jgi:nucleoid DNA-binding protein
MARKTRSVKGGVQYFKRPYVLNFKEGKPTVYKVQICRGRVIKDADFIAYAANAAHVPESTMITARHAILEAINYFVLNGHSVQIEGLGSFSPAIRVKTVNSESEVSAEDIKKKLVKFHAAGEILDLCSADNISFTENKMMSKQAMNDFAFRLRYYPDSTRQLCLVTDEGKLVTGDFSGGGFEEFLTFDTQDQTTGWHALDVDEDVEAWGKEQATVQFVNKEVDGQIVRDYTLITVGHGELKLSAGGTLSPQPFYEYVEEGE